ncbi:MAG: hypothetical protein ACKVJV_10450 [Gammaproteobacteria bacterium]|jgi:hypothetical protein
MSKRQKMMIVIGAVVAGTIPIAILSSYIVRRFSQDRKLKWVNAFHNRTTNYRCFNDSKRC